MGIHRIGSVDIGIFELMQCLDPELDIKDIVYQNASFSNGFRDATPCTGDAWDAVRCRLDKDTPEWLTPDGWAKKHSSATIGGSHILDPTHAFYIVQILKLRSRLMAYLSGDEKAGIRHLAGDLDEDG